jgi:hypothetical protein
MLRWKLIVLGKRLDRISENFRIRNRKFEPKRDLKKHKPWFEKEFSKLLDQKKQAKLQWLQDPSERNGENLNNVR